MYKYKIFNNIAQDGIDILNQNMQEDNNNPDALLLRIQKISIATLSALAELVLGQTIYL